MIASRLESGSFRDRESRVFYGPQGVFRGLSKTALEEWEALSATSFYKRFGSEGMIVPTERVDTVMAEDSLGANGWAAVLKHETIPFISYPYEWPFGMLKDAALIQLELLRAALDEGMILKDSSAFNFQWKGAKPVFIDIPSFVKLAPGAPWVGYRQFCQMFLYPLFLQAYKGVPFHPWLRGSIDGIDPEQISRLMSVRDLFRPGVFMHAYLHAKVQSKHSSTNTDVKAGLRAAGFNREMIKANIRRLTKIVRDLTWKPAQSAWSDYAENNNYTDPDRRAKETFVRGVIGSRPWNRVWDLGCNTGTFSRIAAENSRYVVAMDADHLAIERLYQSLKTDGNTSILPLVMNLADSSPTLGWRGLERKTLAKRGRPDLTICLALIHHIVIGANIPLKEFVEWVADLKSALVIEFITKDDPMVKKLLLNKTDNYSDYEEDHFEWCLSRFFVIQSRRSLDSGTRHLYFATQK